jgi:hypothetical protein
MTQISNRKTALKVETSAEVRVRGKMRPVVLEFDSRGFVVYMKLKGLRQRLPVDFVTIYQSACKIEARRVAAEKAEAKKLKKGAR